MSRDFHAAIDVGGTFIDVLIADRAAAASRISKVLHRPGHQGEDIITSLADLAERFGGSISDVGTLVVGTTVVTNALLEQKLARTALITTEGFADVIEIARMRRPSSYDIGRARPVPVVPRDLRFEVPERIGVDGSVLTPLDESLLPDLVSKLRAAEVEAIAICFLFSFVDPSHEQRVRDYLARELNVPISISSEVLATFREYERISTTAVNAAASPVMARFLDTLERAVEGKGMRLSIMGSDGGCMTLPEARRFPARCMLSGPAGGVLGSQTLASQLGLGDVLTLDIGGTSSDVALLRADQTALTQDRTISGYSVALPSVEVETVGAGGGSIAYIDSTGLVRVGPRSAGGKPGPACYGLGGEEPTVTDAHVALGRLGTGSMLGGKFSISRQAALEAIETRIAKPTGMSTMRAANGILDIAIDNICRAVRSISIERGHDPRAMTLMPFGGAGPMHALEVARVLQIPRVVIPLYPGVWSAFGILSADLTYSAHRTLMLTVDANAAQSLRIALHTLADGLLARAKADGLDPKGMSINRSADFRYRGQSHSLTVSLAGETETDLDVAVAAFHVLHEQRFGHGDTAASIELVNVGVSVRQPNPGIVIDFHSTRGNPAPRSHRDVWFGDQDPVNCPVFERGDLPVGHRIEGPAVVEQYDSNLVLMPGDKVVVAEGGPLIIEINQKPQRV
jgi:N-methylhydantoinase A